MFHLEYYYEKMSSGKYTYSYVFIEVYLDPSIMLLPKSQKEYFQINPSFEIIFIPWMILL